MWQLLIIAEYIFYTLRCASESSSYMHWSARSSGQVAAPQLMMMSSCIKKEPSHGLVSMQHRKYIPHTVSTQQQLNMKLLKDITVPDGHFACVCVIDSECLRV